MKKYITILLAFIMLFTSLALTSCGNAGNVTHSDVTEASTDSPDISTEVTESSSDETTVTTTEEASETEASTENGQASNEYPTEAVYKKESITMNTGWLYSSKDYENGEVINLNEKDFEQVGIPHANTLLEKHKGDDFMEQIDSYRFISWYRRHFKLDESYADKSIYINFEGVATVADVYVNGSYVGNHRGAYTGFTFDITDYVKTDGSDNVIAVKVDSERQSEIPPEGGRVDYCVFGGIVRDVNLIVKEKLHIDNIFVTTPGIKDGDSSMSIAVDVLNGTGNDSEATVNAVVKDVDGNIVATGEGKLAIGKDSHSIIDIITSQVPDVILWDIDNPYLYTVEVSVISDGMLLDTVSERIGFRYFEFTATETESAFYLNGVKTVINGINRHEQWPWIGRAVNNKYQAADADLIKATGFNAVRCSHYPQDTAFLDRCDEIGLLVFEEAPGWQHLGGEAWQEVYKTNIEEMILRDRNHTSIITWGVRVNESGDSHNLYEETNALAKALDPSRPTHGVRNPVLYEDSECQEDIFTVNYSYPEVPRIMPYVVTEYQMDWTSGNGKPGANIKGALDFTHSFAWVLDYFYSNNFCSGGFGWSMFDYNNEVNYTETEYVFYSGLYDIFRYPKPVSYYYKSQLDPDDEVVLYIANYWADEGNQDVWVMSNCDEVELFVNGKSVGKIQPNTYTNIPHPVYKFCNVAYEAGELKAVGYIDGKEVKTTVVKTPEAAASIRLTPDYETIVADGSDFTSVTVELIDKNGTVLPYASDEVTITVEGAGKFIGEQTIALEGGHTAFFVQSEYLKTGDITCTVKLSDNNSISGSCKLKAIEYVNEDELPVSEYEQGTEEAVEYILYDINDSVVSSKKKVYFSYTENWVYYSQETNCYMQDNHYTDLAGEVCTLSFVGTSAKIYGAKAPNHGIFKVSVDGGEAKLVDCYNQNRMDNQVLFEVSGLAEGEHTITIEVAGDKNMSSWGAYINIDRAIIDGKNVDPVEIAPVQEEKPAEPDAPVGEISYDLNDNDTNGSTNYFTYSGWWTHGESGNCYQQDDHYSNTEGDTCVLTFKGTGAVIYGTKAPHHGIFEVSVDGGEAVTVDCYNADRQDGLVLFEISELAEGEHTVTVKVTADKNEQSTGNYINIDRAVIEK